jgi:hypothetical protein
VDFGECHRVDRDGWIAVPGLLDASAALELAARCEALLEHADEVRQNDKRVAGTHRAASVLERVPEVGRLFTDTRLVEVVTHLLGGATAITDVGFRCPQPGFGEQTLHCDDLPLTKAGDCRAVTAIVALCDFTAENGTTAIVPGSHRRPDLQRAAAKVRLEEVSLCGPAGTAFVFSAHLLHRGTRNRSSRPRPALQAQWRT